MQGLRELYDDTGRGAAWRRLVEAVVPDFVDPATDGARPGIDQNLWSLVTGYRVHLARSDRRGAEAERLQRLRVDVDRNRAQPLLAAAPETLGADERNAVRNLAVSLHELGEIQREAGEASCAELVPRIPPRRRSDRRHLWTGRLRLQPRHSVQNIASLRDLGEAERWLRRSLGLLAPGDNLGRGKCFGSLGNVAWERFKDARAAERPDDELTRHLTDAVGAYEQALDLLPEHAVTDRGIAHNQLGIIFSEYRRHRPRP